MRVIDPAPDECLIEREHAELVRQALMNLPETHRAVVVLREYERMKLREIAQTLDIPEGTDAFVNATSIGLFPDVDARLAVNTATLSSPFSHLRSHVGW